MTVIGIIGIIGTVEYLEAQTPTILDIPRTNIPDAIKGSSILQSTGTTNTWLNTNNRSLFNSEEPHIGHTHFKKDTLLEPHQLFVNVTTDASCITEVRSVKLLLNTERYPNAVPNIAIPDNIKPNTNRDDIIAIGFDFYNRTANIDRSISCTPNPEATSKSPLFTRENKELRYTIIGKHDKKPYYFSPRENITQAQPIPACTTETFDTTTQTLKGDTKMCYGKNSNDMVIITKRVTGFYGAADSITTPTNPIALDSNIVETQKEYDEKIKREKDYLALLERLYLPPI